MYIEYYSVKSILKTVQGEPETASKSATEIEETIVKRLQINEIHRVTKNDITITKDGKKVIIEIAYEARIPLFGNIDVVGDFKDNRVEVIAP